MEEFPFSEAEWSPLKEVALSILNAGSAGDDILKASLRLDMLDLLCALRDRHGEHPVLLETMADYSEDIAERVAMYRRAVDLSVANGLPTLSIRHSLGRLLVEMGNPVAAMEELRACGNELPGADEDQRARWLALLEDSAYGGVDDAERAKLYRQAMDIAASNGQPTLSIHLSLVRLLLDMGTPVAAMEELRACESEVPGADEDERARWLALRQEASQIA